MGALDHRHSSASDLRCRAATRAFAQLGFLYSDRNLSIKWFQALRTLEPWSSQASLQSKRATTDSPSNGSSQMIRGGATLNCCKRRQSERVIAVAWRGDGDRSANPEWPHKVSVTLINTRRSVEYLGYFALWAPSSWDGQ
jgi:hypothetical protein